MLSFLDDDRYAVNGASEIENTLGLQYLAHESRLQMLRMQGQGRAGDGKGKVTG
jgi:hypothetical protein